MINESVMNDFLGVLFILLVTALVGVTLAYLDERKRCRTLAAKLEFRRRRTAKKKARESAWTEFRPVTKAKLPPTPPVPSREGDFGAAARLLHSVFASSPDSEPHPEAPVTHAELSKAFAEFKRLAPSDSQLWHYSLDPKKMATLRTLAARVYELRHLRMETYYDAYSVLVGLLLKCAWPNESLGVDWVLSNHAPSAERYAAPPPPEPRVTRAPRGKVARERRYHNELRRRLLAGGDAMQHRGL